jgi:hypothetical protein
MDMDNVRLKYSESLLFMVWKSFDSLNIKMAYFYLLTGWRQHYIALRRKSFLLANISGGLRIASSLYRGSQQDRTTTAV